MTPTPVGSQRKDVSGFSTQYKIPSEMQSRMIVESHDEWLFPSCIFRNIALLTPANPFGNSRLLTAGVIAREKLLQIGAADKCMHKPLFTKSCIRLLTAGQRRSH